ncbi:MAG: hypothetical protein ACD_72C00519G0001 [uncultured bacterium]|nr:MAG: hypothetical protein ACD_72C00519G0001 [uncultured bacterium]
MDCVPDMAIPNKNQVAKYGNNVLFFIARTMGTNGLKFIFVVLRFLFVSGKKIIAKTTLIVAMIPAIQNGKDGEIAPRTPPSIGPKIKPIPNIAPTMPRLCVRSLSSLEISTR